MTRLLCSNDETHWWDLPMAADENCPTWLDRRPGHIQENVVSGSFANGSKMLLRTVFSKFGKRKNQREILFDFETQSTGIFIVSHSKYANESNWNKRRMKESICEKSIHRPSNISVMHACLVIDQQAHRSIASEGHAPQRFRCSFCRLNLWMGWSLAEIA